ncbi:hypothetical protein HID58_006765 [Brassica napus]|uniref:Uncharacterized protein n=2 Tax=Brassica napus TaxID=3708 RepID=A0ABQ8ECA2_BRANA|nr:hypothetical protein HID58_006765 [Brassica napus]
MPSTRYSSVKSTTETKFEEMQTQEGVELNDPTTPANFSIYSKVTVATSSNFQSTSSPLAGTLPAPTQNSIMEGIPSPIIVSETNLVSRNNSLAFMTGNTVETQSLSHIWEKSLS